MSFVLIALLLAANNECASSYKPLLPKFISTKLESIQSQSSRIKKVFGSLVIAGTLANSPFLPMNVQPVAAQQDRYNNKLNAPTAIGTRVNSDAESLLRYGTFFSYYTSIPGI